MSRRTPAEALEAVFCHGNRFRYTPGAPLRYEANWFATGDGSRISVIAGWGTYCSPRPGWAGGVPDDYEGPFHEVEAWLPGDDDPAQISVPDLREWIAAHGGLVAGPTETEGALPGSDPS